MRVDEQFMQEVGLGEMPEGEKQAFMEHAQEELEVRVGHHVGAELTDQQMLEFENIEDVNEAVNWLERNVPNYRTIVEQVYQGFKNELLAERQKILS